MYTLPLRYQREGMCSCTCIAFIFVDGREGRCSCTCTVFINCEQIVKWKLARTRSVYGGRMFVSAPGVACKQELVDVFRRW